jgi:GNAT superfamily N-acetyltransferase
VGQPEAKVSVGATVRPATAGDVPQLVELNALVQTEHVAAEPDVFKPTRADEVAAWFAAELEASSERVWVAASGAQVVGYVTALAEARPEHLFCHARSWWEVDQLAVHPGWRRRGVARALLAAVAAEASRPGVGQLQLSTWCFNTGALEAWRHLGFAPQTTRLVIDSRRLTG